MLMIFKFTHLIRTPTVSVLFGIVEASDGIVSSKMNFTGWPLDGKLESI